MRNFFRPLLFLPPNSSIEQNARWYIRTRWYFLLAIGIPSILSNVAIEGVTAQVKRDVTLVIVALLSNLVFLVLSRLKRSENYFRRIVITLIAFDIITVTVLIFIKGGVESRSPILYTIPMLMASAIFSRKGVYSSLAAVVFLYDSLILLDWLGVINSIGAVNPSLPSNTAYMLNTICFFTAVLVIIASLADFTTKILYEKEQEAHRKTIALEQAQQLAQLGSWEWEIDTNKITWTKQLYEMFGLKPSEFKATYDSYLKLLDSEDRELAERLIQDSMATLEPFSFEHKILRGNETRWVYAEGQIEANANGKPSRMFGTAQDITDRKLAESKIQKQSQNLEKLNAVMVGRELKMVELKEQLAAKQGAKK